MTQSGKKTMIAQNQLNKIYLKSLQNLSIRYSILLSMKNAMNTDISTPVERVQVASPNIKAANTIFQEAGK